MSITYLKPSLPTSSTPLKAFAYSSHIRVHVRQNKASQCTQLQWLKNGWKWRSINLLIWHTHVVNSMCPSSFGAFLMLPAHRFERNIKELAHFVMQIAATNAMDRMMSYSKSSVCANWGEYFAYGKCTHSQGCDRCLWFVEYSFERWIC